ncbi:hypothetical protein HK098_001450 [Nowakowskiella sp. JEL0407]|nr:hypothetical protein HK098_001450 [Nowakowskiella sp. JEL0407]
MEPTPELLAELQQHEKDCVFPSFSASTALKLGLKIISSCPPDRAISVSISKNSQLLFYHSMDGTTPDNADWIRRKNNTVNRFHCSSYRFGRGLKFAGDSLAKFGASETEYCTHGGGFPLIVQGAGVVGVIIVSGLPEHEDHMLAVKCIKECIGAV